MLHTLEKARGLGEGYDYVCTSSIEGADPEYGVEAAALSANAMGRAQKFVMQHNRGEPCRIGVSIFIA